MLCFFIRDTSHGCSPRFLRVLNFAYTSVWGQKVLPTSITHVGYHLCPPLSGVRYIKADMYRYRFTKLGSEESKRGQVWTREVIGSYWGMTSRDGLVEAIRRNS